jgi:hypothetical protein
MAAPGREEWNYPLPEDEKDAPRVQVRHVMERLKPVK